MKFSKREKDYDDYNWHKFVSEEIPYGELCKLTIECISEYWKIKHTIKHLKLREIIDKYIEDAIIEDEE